MRIPQLIRNADRPRGAVWGRLMIIKMNLFHSKLSRWGLGHLRVPKGAVCLDIGCGGGRNVARLRRRAKGGRAYGVDLSSLSVRQSVWLNLPAILGGKSAILHAGADDLPFKDAHFDVVTAFETVYYWPDPVHCFEEVRRVLRPGGQFMICNEDTYHADRPEEHTAIKSILDLSFYSNDELEQMLRDAGFRYVRSATHSNGRWVVLIGHA